MKLKDCQKSPKSWKIVVVSARISVDEKRFIEENEICVSTMIRATLKEIGYKNLNGQERK